MKPRKMPLKTLDGQWMSQAKQNRGLRPKVEKHSDNEWHEPMMGAFGVVS